MSTLDLTLRIIGVVLLALLASLMLRTRRPDHTARVGAALAIGVGAFLLTSMRHASQLLGVFEYPLSAICATHPVWFWLFCTALFSDRFKLTRRHLLCVAAMALFGLAYQDLFQADWRSQQPGLVRSVGIAFAAASLTFICLGPLAVYAGRRADLDERRRRIRTWFVPLVSGYLAAVVVVVQAAVLFTSQPGVVVWGGGATTWFERMLRFERNALELGNTDPASLNAEVDARALFLERYLLRGESPGAIAASDPELGKVWTRIVGTSGNTHYGRPPAFHQQAQRQNWPGAWARVRSPVLVLYGDYDWFESRDAAALIADIVNRKRPGTATLRVMPQLDHHLSRYATREDAFRERGGTENAAPVVEAILAWLKQIGAE